MQNNLPSVNWGGKEITPEYCGDWTFVKCGGPASKTPAFTVTTVPIVGESKTEGWWTTKSGKVCHFSGGTMTLDWSKAETKFPSNG